MKKNPNKSDKKFSYKLVLRKPLKITILQKPISLLFPISAYDENHKNTVCANPAKAPCDRSDCNNNGDPSGGNTDRIDS